MTNFDFGIFYGDEYIFAVIKAKYSEKDADELFVKQVDLPLERSIKQTGWVYYGIGYNQDHERVSGYWYSTNPVGRYPQECWAYVY